MSGSFQVEQHVVQRDPSAPQMVTVLYTSSFAITGSHTLTVIGPEPLVIYATGNISIDGTIDVSSHVGDGTQFAGASSCGGAGDDRAGGNGVAAMQASGDLGGGGGGGANGGSGGSGGSGGPSDGGAGGGALPLPDYITGGCPGGNGGPGFGNEVSAGGAGGGAIELVTPGTIHLTNHGKLLAGGAGGQGAGHTPQDFGGAGGGGAGGFAALGAGTCTLDGNSVLEANGGGGGGGGKNSGSDGADATANTTPAPGGSGQGNDPHGGDGAASSSSMTSDGDSPPASSEGGAGGGGGTGFVIFHCGSLGKNPGAVTSPVPIQI